MKPLLISAVLIAATIASTSTASANHPSYCYTGHCLHIDGEQHMIDALQAMDHLYAAPCVRTRGKASVPVQRELGRAIGDVESTDARLLLIKSQGLVGRFVGTGDGYFLDSAAQLVTQAIEAEQLAHQRLHASDRIRSNRPSYGYSHPPNRPSDYADRFGFSYSTRRAPSSSDRYRSYSGHSLHSRPAYRDHYRPSYGPGCNSRPSSGFSIRIGH